MINERKGCRPRDAHTDQIRHLDEALEAGVVLDVETVELDAGGPGVTVLRL